MLISDEYRQIQSDLHESNPNYGVASQQFAPLVAKIVRETNPKELLDYGAGKGRLGIALNEILSSHVEIHHYDPAIPHWASRPAPCEFVCCIDVLEHVEPKLLGNVLDDLQRVTSYLGFYTVHTGAAVKVLSDGRNAHLLQRPAKWWLPHIMERFELNQFQRTPNGFWVVVQKLISSD